MNGRLEQSKNRGPSAPSGKLRRPRRTGRFLLKLVQYLCLLVGLVCLGWVAFDYGGARIFQTYQSWRFDQITGHQSRESALNRWIDRTLSLFVKPPAPPAPVRRGGSAAPPPVQTLPAGAVVGRLEIPRIGISAMVLEGDSEAVLRNAVGHVPATGFPGGPGNVVVAGHRDTFFRPLRNIQKDDEITFTTLQGTYRYRVESTERVGPKDVRVLQATSHPMLTLVTCYPFYYIGAAPKRFIVQAWQIQPSHDSEPDRPVPGFASASFETSTAASKSAPAARKAPLIASALPGAED